MFDIFLKSASQATLEQQQLAAAAASYTYKTLDFKINNSVMS